MIPSPDTIRKLPKRRPFAPLKATRPAANAAKRAIPISAPQAGVEQWENEGGHLRGERAAAIRSADAPPVESGRPGQDLEAMKAQFAADFADGLIGRNHNTYQHRARVLRQLSRPESAD